jgi:S1-C subfamily serine protease
MTRLAAALLVVLAALSALAFARGGEAPREVTPRGPLASDEQRTVDLFRTLSPSVVNVTVQAGGRGFSDEQGTGSGTGFVWDEAGHIVTNAHVIEGAQAIRVRFGTGETYEAEIVGVAPNADLAVLRIAAPNLPPPLPLGTSSDLQVGQSVLAIGNPFGLDQTLTTGVISALRRQLQAPDGREIANVIQTDAAINPGNSGGPLIDSAGRLVGVNTAIYSPSGASAGIGFAIPADTVNRVVPMLIRDGRVPIPVIGVQLASEEAVARAGLEGLVILRTLDGSPAERAGLRGVNERTGELGDIIVAAEGEKVRALGDLSNVLERLGIGGTVTLTILRDGSQESVKVGIADGGPAAPR